MFIDVPSVALTGAGATHTQLGQRYSLSSSTLYRNYPHSCPIAEVLPIPRHIKILLMLMMPLSDRSVLMILKQQVIP